jgi:hypothetical protein
MPKLRRDPFDEIKEHEVRCNTEGTLRNIAAKLCFRASSRNPSYGIALWRINQRATGRPEENRSARTVHQLMQFHHFINSDKVFSTYNDEK